jgi:hypothetical protein
MSTNDFVVGFKGYMAGDAAMVLAEWIPIYFTPVWQAPYLQNQLVVCWSSFRVLDLVTCGPSAFIWVYLDNCRNAICA